MVETYQATISERSSQEKKAGNEGHSVEEIGPVEVIHR